MSYSTTYPRPDFVRTKLKWKSLTDQTWTLLFDDHDVGLKDQWHVHGVPDNVPIDEPFWKPSAYAQKLTAFPELKEKGFEAARATHYEKKPIKVPFAFQTPASGWGDNGAHEVLWYETKLSDSRSKEDIAAGHRVLVRFGAVDYEAMIWINGNYVGGHRGGHVPFDIDVTDELSKVGGEALLVMRVYDSPSDLTQPRGKQYWAPVPESIFYTPTSGIWQTVWVEVVPPERIGSGSEGTVLRSDDIKDGMLHAKVAIEGRRANRKYVVEIEASIHDIPIGKIKQDLPEDKKSTKPEVLKDPICWLNGLAMWSPRYPTLYDLKVRLLGPDEEVLDEVNTYTGMRSVDWTGGDGQFRLNGQPFFQVLCLDQGYWPETGITPPTPGALKTDVELAKKMGFNGCRKHQKVEDPLFLYWADKLGYLVWGEMANAYEFSEEYVRRFDQEWIEAMKRDINHPSIIVWTPVNESWGYTSLKDNVEQRNHLRSLYYMTKTLDPTRPCNENDGWEHVLTDLTTFHDYSDAGPLSETCSNIDKILGPKLGDRALFMGPTPDNKDDGTCHKRGAPVLCTEFGGVNIAPAEGTEKGERDWGYQTASDPNDLLKRIKGLVTSVVKGGNICGFVYTQLTDIEQEVNGLYTFSRVPKLDPVLVSEALNTAAGLYFDVPQKHP